MQHDNPLGSAEPAPEAENGAPVIANTPPIHPLYQSLRRALRRLYLRRWLVLVVGIMLALFVVLGGLVPAAALAGLAVFCLAAALLPREGLLRKPRPVIRAPEEPDARTLLQAMLNGLVEPAIILDVQGDVVLFNDRARDLFPLLNRGAHVSTAIRHPNLLGAITRVGPDHPYQPVQIAEVVPVARLLTVSLSWLGLPDKKAGAPVSLLLMRDLTEQERIGQMRADFVANASHELKTPLASVLGFIETLQGAARNDAAARDRFLAIMGREARRMARVINDLLTLSRAEMNAHLRPTDRVELGEVIGMVCVTLEPLAVERSISVMISPKGLPAYVLGDREGLIEVFENLIENAVKYGREGGFVRIDINRKVEEPSGKGRAGGQGRTCQIVVSVRDNGLGIPSADIPRLTERFYRVNVSASRDRGGTGLGLSIVKHVLNRHRGQLRIASQLGKGTVAQVFLSEELVPGDRSASRSGGGEASPQEGVAPGPSVMDDRAKADERAEFLPIGVDEPHTFKKD